MWFKYRHKFSYGPTGWRFIKVQDKECLRDLMSEYDSKHYQEIEFIRVNEILKPVIESFKKEQLKLLKRGKSGK